MPDRLDPRHRVILERLCAVVAVLGLLAQALQIALRATQPLGNSDVFWQVRTGEITLATGHVPAVDPFSYTIAGGPWNNHEWAFEILAALLHRSFGWGAFRLLVLVVWGGAAILVAAPIVRRAGLGPALLVLTLFHALAGYKMKPVPQALSMPLLLGAIHLFRGPVMLGSRRRVAALGVYLLVWGNLTAEALTFLPILFLDQLCLRRAAAEAHRDPPPDRVVLLLVILASLAPLVNPPWSSTLDYAVRGAAVNRLVNAEFTPLWRAAAAVQPIAKIAGRIVVALYVAWTARVLLRSGERWAALRSHGVGLVAVLGAVLVERDLWLLVWPAGQMLIALSRRDRLATGAAATALSLVLGSVYTWEIGWNNAAAWAAWRDARYRATHLDDTLIPTACIDRLADAPAGTRLFTLRLWASYAIWRVPQVKVFYDGRNLEYGTEIAEAGAHVWTGGPNARRILDATGTEVVIARPGWDELPGVAGGPWQARATTAAERCTVFVRQP
jgi:hypothetical protein